MVLSNLCPVVRDAETGWRILIRRRCDQMLLWDSGCGYLELKFQRMKITRDGTGRFVFGYEMSEGETVEAEGSFLNSMVSYGDDACGGIFVEEGKIK